MFCLYHYDSYSSVITEFFTEWTFSCSPCKVIAEGGLDYLEGVDITFETSKL